MATFYDRFLYDDNISPSLQLANDRPRFKEPVLFLQVVLILRFYCSYIPRLCYSKKMVIAFSSYKVSTSSYGTPTIAVMAG